jgi:hypothetical protein
VSRRLFVIISLALLTWVLSVAHALPIDANGPSGFSDNADLDDLIVSVTSPTAAVASATHLIVMPTYRHITERIAEPPPLVLYVVRSAVEGRAPPLV